MFGGELNCPPRPPPAKRLPSELQDNLMTAPMPYHFAHFAPKPSTDYRRRLLQYKQRMIALTKERLARELEEKTKLCVHMRFISKTDETALINEIDARVEAKMREYEQQLEDRRNKLRDLLAREERECCKETVDQFQQGKRLKFEEMMRQREELVRIKQENHRKVVEEKRIQQSIARCQELRPYVCKRNLLDSKHVQLLQMKDNELRRRAEKEIDMVWDDVMSKEVAALIKCEEHEKMKRHDKTQRQKEFLDTQIKAKEMAKEEAARLKKEDHMEMRKWVAQTEEDEIKRLTKERMKKDQFVAGLNEQVQWHQKMAEEREKSDKISGKAFLDMSKLEYEQNLTNKKALTELARREQKQYKRSLADLLRQREEEERNANVALKAEQESIEWKQDEIKCKQQHAREKLLKDVMRIRDEQLIYKKEAAERVKVSKEAEDELARARWEEAAELDRNMVKEARVKAKQCSEDRHKQIEYSKILKIRQGKELERECELAKAEEEKYKEEMLTCIRATTERSKHPFRAFLEQNECCECYCPSAKHTH